MNTRQIEDKLMHQKRKLWGLIRRKILNEKMKIQGGSEVFLSFGEKNQFLFYSEIVLQGSFICKSHNTKHQVVGFF